MLQLGILLAAGFGRRFQAQQANSNKLLMCLAPGQSVVGTSLNNLRQHVDEVCVVIRPASTALQAELARHSCWVVESPLAYTGMGASLADAVHAVLHRYTHAPVGSVLITLADMPCITAASMRAVQQAAQRHAITAPVYQGQRGHPVGFQWQLMPELARLSGEQGARQLIAQHGIELLAVDDPGVCFDIDTPDDLQHPLLSQFISCEARKSQNSAS
ncbi:nucleotidyltransferase family protein [Alcaligenes endophyticus]|uniref:Nucleotidyltransferase family protein n=1 Tax=Alcaligenes endophyticus TaxID=1929088 RepID=A0ABT8EGH2_9BURK|nr:nucleotidyltransferase family protein [Alcaligenes endophyticus]MCX5589947.1 nucleotidyltransferase family protein [Alcaligenes endophyticus]MDN4120390.1 nucleotidyltransferase family protein [Alcaligenes endophyticus]